MGEIIFHDFMIPQKRKKIGKVLDTGFSPGNMLLEPVNKWGNSEAYSEPCHPSKMECFAKIGNSF